MPLLEPSEKQRAAARAAAGADLIYLLDREGVDAKHQEVLFHVGVCSLPRLAAFAKDVADLKGVLAEDCGLDAAASIGARVQVASII